MPLVSRSLNWAIKPFQICPSAPSPGSRILIQGEPSHPTSPLSPHLLTPLPGSPRQALAWLSSAIPQPWPQRLLSLLPDSGEARLAPSHPSVKISWHRNQTWVSCFAGRFFTIRVTREAPGCNRRSTKFLWMNENWDFPIWFSGKEMMSDLYYFNRVQMEKYNWKE